ncbi:Muconate cycloisomerase 1 [Mycena indigotica]|uniref:Muconate cycloisomerase 1 n=1 Tax=Mycena indigotica TaxID=2126181 RepID=A0A8H6SQP6_9AGAR|nr:Muconate cycloisomerase 1 [Mycena indigotica]KAF7303741.1 Muconate cycloisomerase 1 [Mycena indigotica]
MDIFQQPLEVVNRTAGPVHHLLSGSFRSISLFLLAFSPLQRSIELVQTIPAFGPHQYIALSPSGGDTRYAFTTTWAQPPKLHSWAIDQGPHVRLVNSVEITATSSYITVPPPFSHIYSAGGPTAQVHTVDSHRGFGPHLQEIYFVAEEEWETADKTRKALVISLLLDRKRKTDGCNQRYGSHGIEFAFPIGSIPLAFIPVLGRSTIEIYRLEDGGKLRFIESSSSPQRADGISKEDGPRHVKIHPNGRVLYCVTEHSNYLDVYTINGEGETPILTYVASRSLLPPYVREEVDVIHDYRGDTLILAPSTAGQPAPQSIFVSTRGTTACGWVSVFRLDDQGMFAGDIENNPYLVERYEALTGGGKAHALDIIPKQDDADGGCWLVLTDDSPPHPGVRVLEWDGWLWRGGGTRLREVASWPPTSYKPSDGDERMEGGSHAVWL